MAVADGRFFTFQELQDRISQIYAVRVFDDDELGQIKNGPAQSVIAKADARVAAHGAKNYPSHVDSTVTPGTAHPYIKELALDYAVACAMHRYPTLFRGHNTVAEMERAEQALRDLATGKTHLEGVSGGATNERAVVGSAVRVGGSTARTFDSFGDF